MAKKIMKLDLDKLKPLREVICDTIREAIVMGELKPGERLMEVALSEKMGVSRTPIREALRILELEGFVKMIPRKGVHVAELTPKDIMDVLEIRASLDSLAASLAAERITEDELKDLSNAKNQFENYIEKSNLQGLIKKDIEFHDIIYKASRNEKLLNIMSNLSIQIQRFRIIYLKDYVQPKDLAKEHEEIYNAILKRDINNAAAFSSKHVRTQEERIIAALEKINIK